VGKAKVLNALDYLIRDKKSEKANPKEIKELEQRRKRISKLED
jgi:ribosomal protein L9